MQRAQYTVSLRQVEDKWIASFHRGPMSAPSGFGSGTTPWKAVQVAAWAAVKRAASRGRGGVTMFATPALAHRRRGW
jgi:hypothetical protein